MNSIFYFLGTPGILAEEGPQNAIIILRHIIVRNARSSHYSSSHHSHPHLRNHQGTLPPPETLYFTSGGSPNMWLVSYAAK